jgi:hypothetical protein
MESKGHLAFAAARNIGAAASCAAVVALCLVAAPAARAAGCPNEAVRETQTSEAFPAGTTVLPSCMALEMVSPPKKLGQEVAGVTAFSPDGERALFVSKAALAETPGQQALVGDDYVAERASEGWAAMPTTAPAEADISTGGGGIAQGGPFAFGPQLGGWVLVGATQFQKQAGEAQFFRGGLGGFFAPLSPLLTVTDDSGVSSDFVNLDQVAAATGLSAAVFKTSRASTALLPEDPRGTGANEVGSYTNSYLASLDATGNPTVQLLARDHEGTVYGGRCGSRLGNLSLVQGALSGDGSRLDFSTRPAQPPSVGSAGPACSLANPLRILVRTETPSGPVIAPLLPGAAANPTAPGDDSYQGASLDGSKVFLVTPRNLAPSDQDTTAESCGSSPGGSKGCDLYLYDSSLPGEEGLIQVSAGEAVPGQHQAGKGADVLSSLTAISSDGSHAYFVAEGVLTGENVEHRSPVAGQPNLYLYERDGDHPSGHTAFVATLAATDNSEGRLWGSGSSFTDAASAVPMLGGAAGGDGHVLVFVSAASLTPDDADSGHTDVFRYESQAGTLECLSCGDGAPDAQPFDVTVGSTETSPSSDFAVLGRWASEDGGTAAFVTAEPLVPDDTDGHPNPYLWKEGRLTRLPGTVAVRSHRPTVSPSGEEVGFTTTSPLLPQDGDTARDAYVARVDGGFPNLIPPVPCDPMVEGACQGPPTGPGKAAALATSSFAGLGNRIQAPTCRKGFVRKRGRCVKPHRKAGKHQRRSGRNGGKSR